MTLNKKRIVFLTGTRADFGKLKPLIKVVDELQNEFDLHIYATGMHMSSKYGYTIDEIEKSGFPNIFKFFNHDRIENMDRTLSKTIEGFSMYIREIKPDLIIVHGDRVEALAGAIVGSLNNTLVAHIEGGEMSGTIDESIRHAVTKLSHIHLVSNEKARNLVYRLGENYNDIHVIGSPDIDVMFSKDLPPIKLVKSHYEIPFEEFYIVMFHPVTTEFENINYQSKELVQALLESKKNYVIIYPNNDLGSDQILFHYNSLRSKKRFRLYPSLRFEYFLTLLKNCSGIIGNSSAGIREAPLFNIPTINIGSRQNKRSQGVNTIINIGHSRQEILTTIHNLNSLNIKNHQTNVNEFGDGNSSSIFRSLITSEKFWSARIQKELNNKYDEEKNYRSN